MRRSARTARSRRATPRPITTFARELRRSGATLGPEWERPLAMLREHLERARADWYLAELAKIEA